MESLGLSCCGLRGGGLLDLLDMAELRATAEDIFSTRQLRCDIAAPLITHRDHKQSLTAEPFRILLSARMASRHAATCTLANRVDVEIALVKASAVSYEIPSPMRRVREFSCLVTEDIESFSKVHQTLTHCVLSQWRWEVAPF